MKTAQDIVQTDLAYMAERLSSEFGEMAGKRLLIIGGAGFLGYYLVQAALYYNDVSGKAPIQLTVFDNYMRGMPDWLKALEGRKDLTLRKHDVLDALPADLPPQDYLIHELVWVLVPLDFQVREQDEYGPCCLLRENQMKHQQHQWQRYQHIFSNLLDDVRQFRPVLGHSHLWH